jgi:hypothetical protein
MIKQVLRINVSTTDEFVRGEVGMFELERERDRTMLAWAGRVVGMGKERWVRRVYDIAWKEINRGRVKSWKRRVQDLLAKYGLVKEFEKLKEGALEDKWDRRVRDEVQRQAIEDWRDGVQRGRKLDLYAKVKKEWGFEEYLEGIMGKGEILMTRFRSGSAAIGEETKRWGGGGEGVWDDDGVERKKRGECKVCKEGCVETLQHMLIECAAFREMREKWWSVVRSVVGIGSDVRVLSEEVCGFNPLELMLGWKHPKLSEDDGLRVLVASTCLFAKLWSTRADLLYGQWGDPLGVNDAFIYDTTET